MTSGQLGPGTHTLGDAPRARRRRGWRRATVVVVAVVLLTVTVVNQSAVHWRGNIVDDLLFAYHGWCVSTGARPYLDIWDNKPPGIWWANAAAFRLCGEGVAAELLLGGVAVLAVSLALMGAARTAFHRTTTILVVPVAAVMMSDLRFECGANRTETYVVLCETLAAWGYLRWLRRGRWRWLALAGLAGGAAPLFKQAGIAAIAAGALHLAWTQIRSRAGTKHAASSRGNSPVHSLGWRPWAIAAAAVLAAPALAAGVLWCQGALGEAAFAVGRFNRAYFAVGEATWWRLDSAIRLYGQILGQLAAPGIIAAVGLIWAATAGLSRRVGVPPACRPHRGVGMIALWLVLGLYLACTSPGRQNHHLMPILPPLALLLLHFTHLVAGRRGLWAQMTARPMAAAALVAWLYVPGTVAADSLAEAARCWQVKPHWYSLERRQPAPFELQADVIRRLAGPEETIYVWGWSPGTYRFSYRRAASRFATLEKCGQVGDYARFIIDGAIADLRRRPPRVFVISPRDYEPMADDRASDLGHWIAEHYEHVDCIGGMHIFVRRPTQDPHRR